MRTEQIYLQSDEIESYRTHITQQPDGVVKTLLSLEKAHNSMYDTIDSKISFLQNTHNSMYDLMDSNIIFLQNEIIRLITVIEEIKAPAKMFLNLMKVVNETPALQTEWERFVTLIKLAAEPEDLK